MTTSQTIEPGSLVSFSWNPPTEIGTPGGGSELGAFFPSTLPTVPSPHVVTLGASDALAATMPSASRANDLPVSWTVSGTPLELEKVVVLLTQGVETVTCSFSASALSGVIPADALLELDAGAMAFEVYSLHEIDTSSAAAEEEGGGTSDIRVLVEIAASTLSGIAKGTLTTQ
jgi:hypothetical protein